MPFYMQLHFEEYDSLCSDYIYIDLLFLLNIVTFWQNGTISTTAYVGLLRGTLTWDSYMGILRGTLTWDSYVELT